MFNRNHKNTRNNSASDDLETAAGFPAAGTRLSSAALLADMLTTAESRDDLLDLGVCDWMRLTSGLSALLGSGGKTRGDWADFD